ncbi:hypothetical protein [Cryobacterium lyxosi]|uniref:Uncharacterized protein n=1 Tax=Cryobacterium lyxosi TaxID=1259228 RepID=A0A4R8ZGK8_9MICO|nr:hypothetical protein [Cryobacterium lyxosi]TFD25469.1 hypothetical protein E3T27_12075 [Cryobacterium lyxosi]
MSDNTPTDGKKNPETDAAVAPDLTVSEQVPTDQDGAPEHAAVVVEAESASAKSSVEQEPEQEPIVIDYDAINANLSAAERSDAVSASAAARNLAPMSTATPVASTDAAAPSLTDDYADSYTPAATVPATGAAGAAGDSEPTSPVVPVALVVGTVAAESPSDYTPSDATPIDATPIDATPIDATPIDYTPIDYTLVDAPLDAPVAVAPSYTPPAQSPIYVQAPTKPKNRSNRGGGILIALLATVVFAILYAVAAFIIIGMTSTTMAVTLSSFLLFASLPISYVPVLFFFLAFAGLISLVNRGGWWAYVLFGFVVAVIVYFSFIGAALLGLMLDGTSDGLSQADVSRFVASLWLNPYAIAAAIIAREVPIWAGAWIARRGRRVTARNLEARTEYERLLADGPHVTRP